MVDVQWRFRKMTRAEMNQDPMQREFFEGEAINTRLVRESIQNSLDAAIARTTDTNVPVRVRFSLAGIHKPLQPHIAEKYFRGIAAHLNALPELDDAIGILAARDNLTQKGAPFIVVEDAGTVGLEGDWEQDKDSENQPAQNNHFYWFFRNVGRSGKGDADNGSWGLGKWVFPDASHASAYIAVTRRHSDDETLLMGQSVLKQHAIDGQHYAPYGYFATFADDGFQLPLIHSDGEHTAITDDCIRDFGLQYRSEPGLSVIIPFPRIDGEETRIETSKMLAAIVHNYFYPIISRRLEVTLDEGDGSPPIEITADTIHKALDEANLEESGERSPEAYRSLFRMTQQCLQLPKRDYIDVSIADIANIGDEGRLNIADLRRKYNAYELLALRVSTDVQRKNGALEKSEFRLYAQRDDSLTEGHDYYVRGTLSISDMNFLGQTRARTLLVVDDSEPLAAMLRDSEPPAHTSWRPQTTRVTEHWIAAPRRIANVRRAPLALLRALDTPADSIQKDAFADIFSYSPPPVQSNSRGGRRRNGGALTPIPQKRRTFEVRDTQGGAGFRVSLASAAAAPPEYARLQAAYDVPRGNPLARYQPTDFRLRGNGALPVYIEGGSIDADREAKGNEMYFSIHDPKRFGISVQGFDRNRDVYVRVEQMDAAEVDDGSA